jgi:methylmalonyl-CoA mutase N-terminal domain/subunit
LRTQQILAAETGVANTADPVGGAWLIEDRTDAIEREAQAVIEAIDASGGMLAAIERGDIQRQIQEAAYATQQAIDRGDKIIVGVNRFADADATRIEILRVDPEGERRQALAVQAVRASRDPVQWRESVAMVERAARDGSNLVPPVLAAVEARATLGEIADVLRRVFGEHRDSGA